MKTRFKNWKLGPFSMYEMGNKRKPVYTMGSPNPRSFGGMPYSLHFRVGKLHIKLKGKGKRFVWDAI